MTFKLFFEYHHLKEFDPTTTDTKLSVIDNEQKFIKKYNDGKGLLRGVIGNLEGVERHIKQFNGLGFTNDRINIFEISKPMYDQLKPIVEDKGVSITYGDVLSKPDTNVTHIDFDVTTSITNFERDLNRMLSDFPNIKTGVLVYSRRTGRLEKAKIFSEVEKILDYKGIDRLYINQGMNHLLNVTGNASVSEQTINKVINDHPELTFYIQPYTGLKGSPMISIAFAKVPGSNQQYGIAEKTKGQRLSMARYLYNVVSKFKADDWRKAISKYQLLDLDWKLLQKQLKQISKLI